MTYRDSVAIERGRTKVVMAMDTQNERLAYTVEEARKLLGLGRGSMYEAVRRGDIGAVRIGRRLLIPKAELQRLLDIGDSKKALAQ